MRSVVAGVWPNPFMIITTIQKQIQFRSHLNFRSIFIFSFQRMADYRLAIVLCVLFVVSLTTGSGLQWRPCPELSTSLRFPCRCKVEPFGPKLQLGAVSMDCDGVVFQTESPILPTGAPIISFSQRYSGQQVLPTQVIYDQSIALFFSFSIRPFSKMLVCNWIWVRPRCVSFGRLCTVFT